jgi:hypothetical protein
VPDAWTPSDDSEPSPASGPGFVLLLLVIGLTLLAFAAGAVLVVLDLARTITGLE